MYFNHLLVQFNLPGNILHHKKSEKRHFIYSSFKKIKKTIIFFSQ